jgi:feruloyl esterase
VKKIFLLATLLASASSAWADGTPCEGLTKLNLPHTQVITATVVTKGAFVPPPGASFGGRGPNPIFATLPSFCRVIAVSRPISDSEIKVEVWMPVDGWNGRLEASVTALFSPPRCTRGSRKQS